MAQRSVSRQKNVPGTQLKESQNDPDVLVTVLHDDLTNAENSVGSVDPLLLERLSGNTRGAIKKTNRKTSTTKTDSYEDPIGSDEYLEDDKKLYKIKDGTLPARQSKPARKNTVVGEIDSITTSKSSTNAKSSKNEDQNKVEPNGATKKNTSVSYKDLPSESTLETKKHEELKPTRKLRSSRKHEERESRSVSDFSIENMDWYHEDQDYYRGKCKEVLSDFAIPENRQSKMSGEYYTYLLLDSRKYNNKENISWLDFIAAIFYIGKGVGSRAFQHAKDTEKWLNDDNKIINKRRHKRFLKIQEIWGKGIPIKVFFVTEGIIDNEAKTREAAMIDAMELKRLCNLKHEHYYGVAATMDAREKMELGATLLMEAMEIFKRKEEFDVYLRISLDIVRSERLNVICDNDDSEDTD